MTNLYLSIVRDAIESIQLDLYHARLIDFDDSKLLVTQAYTVVAVSLSSPYMDWMYSNIKGYAFILFKNIRPD